MGFENWDEIRTAYQVARLGTVSGAAEALGVHHATVIRHIDALEGRLGVKLFQRHARGYTPTEAGRELFQVANVTAEQFEHLAGRLRGRGAAVSGELVVTTVESLAPLLLPALTRFREENPEIMLRLISDARLFRLEYGEAHVAVRAGARPEDPDNVVQALACAQVGLFAHDSYVARHGRLASVAEAHAHVFVGPADRNHRAPFFAWMRAHVPEDRVRVRAGDLRDAQEAVRAGAGIGFMPLWMARRCEGLVELMPPRPEWEVPIWLVTHVDLHRTPKVRAVTAALKEAAAGWP